MDFDSSSKFISSLTKFLQSLCNGYVEFEEGIEVIGHIYINVDSKKEDSINYVLNEKLCKNDNSVSFISKSFPAQPAEKPKPPPKKPEEEKPKENPTNPPPTPQSYPHSTNIGTAGPQNTPQRNREAYLPAQKRRRTNNFPSSQQNSYYDRNPNPNTFQSAEEESYYNEYPDSQAIDEKPVIVDADVSIKEEYMSNQNNSNSFQNTGTQQNYLPPESPSSYNSSYDFSYSSFEGAGDPSTLTPAQKEELEMYYRKGTDQHLIFLRNMREAHAMYPFTGKRDKELFDKALAELFTRLPALMVNTPRASETFYVTATRKMQKRRLRARPKLQPRQLRPPAQGQRMDDRNIHAMHQPQRMDRRFPGPDDSNSYFQTGNEQSIDFGISNDSNSRFSTGQGNIHQGFHGAFDSGGGLPGFDAKIEQKVHIKQGNEENLSTVAIPKSESEEKPVASPPEVKFQVTSVSLSRTDDFELIEIDPDEDDGM